jgi:uncharacterized membrane protein
MPGEFRVTEFLDRFLLIVVFLIGIGVILPVTIGALGGLPPGTTTSLLLSAFLLQAIAAPLGLALGLFPSDIIILMACFGIGVILGVFEICRTLGTSSDQVASFIERIRKRTEKYYSLQRYGAASCFLIVWIPGIGLYGTPVIAWLLSWKRITSILFTFAGFMAGCIFFLFFADTIF